MCICRCVSCLRRLIHLRLRVRCFPRRSEDRWASSSLLWKKALGRIQGSKCGQKKAKHICTSGQQEHEQQQEQEQQEDVQQEEHDVQMTTPRGLAPPRSRLLPPDAQDAQPAMPQPAMPQPAMPQPAMLQPDGAQVAMPEVQIVDCEVVEPESGISMQEDMRTLIDSWSTEGYLAFLEKHDMRPSHAQRIRSNIRTEATRICVSLLNMLPQLCNSRNLCNTLSVDQTDRLKRLSS